MTDILTPNQLSEITTRNGSDLVCVWDIDEVSDEKMKRMTIDNLFNGVAMLSGAQSFTGVKTFTANPLVHLASGDVTFKVQSDGVDSYSTFRMVNDARDWSVQIRSDQGDSFVIRDETAAANRVLIDSSGNLDLAGTLTVNDNGSGTDEIPIELYAPNISDTGTVWAKFGVGNSTKNYGYFQFYYAAAGSASNRLDLGIGGQTYALRIGADENITIGKDLLCSNANGPMINNEAASSTVPTLIPNRGDSSSGIGWNDVGIVSLVAASTQVIKYSSTYVNVLKALELTTTLAVNNAATDKPVQIKADSNHYNIGFEDNSGDEYGAIYTTSTNMTLQSWGSTNLKLVGSAGRGIIINSAGQVQLSNIDDTNEGAELLWNGAGSYSDITQDIYQDSMRLFSNSASDKRIYLTNSGAGNFDFQLDGEIIGSGSDSFIVRTDSTAKSLQLRSDSSGDNMISIHGSTHASNADSIHVYTNNIQAMIIDSSQHVSIANNLICTASPGAIRHTNTNDEIAIYGGNSQATGGAIICTGSTSGSYANYIRFFTSNNLRAYFDASGNFEASVSGSFPERLIIPLNEPTSLVNGCIWIA